MTSEALVCPTCRTWVEGSGRFVRCPGCGTRFRASEARLDVRATPAGPASKPDSNVSEWPIDLPDRERSESGDPANGDTGGSTTSEIPWEPSLHDTAHADESMRADGDLQSHEESPRDGLSFNPRVLLTVATALLFFFGNRFLSGEVIIAIFVIFVAAQWFLRRNANRKS